MARQELFSPFQSFVAGRQARQSEDYAATRNKLAEIELADAPAQMQRRNALADVQLQSAQTGLEGAQQQLGADKAKFAYAKLKQAQDSGNPKAFITQQIPDLAAKLQQQGIDINTMDDASVAQLTDQLTRKYAGEAGIAPAQPKAPEPFTLGAGQTRYGPDGKPIASAPVSNEMTPYQKERLQIEREKLNKPSNKAAGSFSTLSPEELKSAGLPEGSVAQRDDKTGRISVVSRPDPNEVKAKVTAAKNSRAYETFTKGIQNLQKTLSKTMTGPLVGRIPAFTASQQEAKAGGAAMAPLLKELFRQAGEGTFTKEDQQILLDMLPDRTTDEDAREGILRNVDALVRSKLGLPPAQGESNGQGGPIRVNTPEEAMALPPGTVFLTPDGRQKVR